jgi:hypothetical protein
MPKQFSTIKRPLSEAEKRERATFYNDFKESFEPEVDVETFVKREIFDETIILKCLKCGFQEEVDYDIIEECWDASASPYPESYCAKCNKPTVVPLDVYNRLKK